MKRIFLPAFAVAVSRSWVATSDGFSGVQLYRLCVDRKKSTELMYVRYFCAGYEAA